MANLRIKSGRHYHAFPPFFSLPWLGEKRMERYVTFDASCAYDSAAYNADDVNKLFGLSFGFGGVHGNSARFGWRWSKSAQCIELLAYVYTDGVKNWDEQLRFPVVAQVALGQRVLCKIDYNPKLGAFLFSVERDSAKAADGVHLVSTTVDLPAFGLTHGFYFGGELTAPHDMSATIDRV